MVATSTILCFVIPSPGTEPTGLSGENAIGAFILAVALMLLAGRLLGELMQRIGQPAVMGQLLAGIVIGQTVLGTIWPGAYHVLFANGPESQRMIDAVAQLGILMLLLLTGMETDLALIRRMRRTAICTSLSGIVLPFACGYLLGQMLPGWLLPDPGRRLATSLFLATALSISSVKIVAMVLMEVDFLRRTVGQIILASAILDDTIGWVIIAVISGLAYKGSVDLKSVGLTITGTGLFLAFSFTVGRRLVAYAIRWSNDHLVIEMPVITTILIIMLAAAALTERLGVHTALGAFIAGILIGQSPILTRHIQEQLRGLIVALFMPVFFTVAGLSADLAVFKSLTLVKIELVLILIASFGKLAGCYAGGRLGKLGHRDSIALAIGMNARGSTEVIIATIGLSIGVLSRDLYTLIVFMAIATTLITPPLLKWALGHIPATGEEKERLEREQAEAKEFVPGVERLLIAADPSGNGKLASRLGGLFAGAREVLATVVELPADSSRGSRAAEPPVAEIIKQSAAAGSGSTGRATAGVNVAPAPQNSQTSSEQIADAVLTQTTKGYDMLFLGVEKPMSQSHPGTSSSEVEKILLGFESPIALVVARGDRLKEGSSGPARILVPATGTDYSRLAAEVAIAIAKASKCPVTALNISRSAISFDLLRTSPKQHLKAGQAVVRDIQELGEREGVEVQTLAIARRDDVPAMLRHVKKGNYDLVVIGVKTRPVEGEGLFLGQSAAILLERSPCSLLLVRS